ncbi:alpha/beta fold hydrolase [Actinoplanes siamensis]|uniref:AB hydrolase-1 domain-containing protein n=1 Tax=Actinoplanes siamensis TaxID=1223317 RepID=A0A919TLY4_9ACTN|nr:alpha/beta hydrolase [Actinoplanes siamensis]GIF06954.1 hypothetical protein Asi03nite_44920 [Actinoplanes siamensis]
MKEQILPPVRTSHVWQGARGRWCYDMWGRNGRPVVLLPAVLFDRTIWWPLAAELRPYAAVIAVDLPGHGGNGGPRPRHTTPGDLIDDLAGLIYHLGIRRAPVIVGHASTAGVATLFTTRYATHAVIIVDADGLSAPVATCPEQYLAALRLDDIPADFRPLAQPNDDPELFTAYQSCLSLPAAPAPGAVTAALAVHSGPAPVCSGAAGRCWQHRAYDRPGRFAQLSEVHRLASDIRALL